MKDQELPAGARHGRAGPALIVAELDQRSALVQHLEDRADAAAGKMFHRPVSRQRNEIERMQAIGGELSGHGITHCLNPIATLYHASAGALQAREPVTAAHFVGAMSIVPNLHNPRMILARDEH